jgi:predicted transposase YbfD/YdcC
MSQSQLSIVEHFADLKDPRREHGKLHRLPDILTIALCAVLAGADSWPEIELFGHAKLDWFRRFLPLPHGIPSHDTFRRVFAALKPAAFQDCFVAWMNAACAVTGLQRIHIDGKSLRASRRRTQGGLCPALHLVSAWAGANHLTLGQVAVAGKSNEITAIPALLQLLDLKGCIVTIDAMGCQKGIAAQIVAGGGDYVLAVKENQGTLYADIAALCERALATDFDGLTYEVFGSDGHGHGRQESRSYLAIYDPPGLRTAEQWLGLKAVVAVTRERRVGDQVSLEQQYYMSSVALHGAQWEEVIRGHWSIENNLHWVLDVVFREDRCRTQDANAAENLAWLRKLAVSLLKGAPGKGSLSGKRKKAGWDEAYLEQLLGLLSVPAEPLAPSPPDLTTDQQAASPD